MSIVGHEVVTTMSRSRPLEALYGTRTHCYRAPFAAAPLEAERVTVVSNLLTAR